MQNIFLTSWMIIGVYPSLALSHHYGGCSTGATHSKPPLTWSNKKCDQWHEGIFMQPPMEETLDTGIILCMHPANERRRYIVTSPLIGWVHTQNEPWDVTACHIKLDKTYHCFKNLSTCESIQYKNAILHVPGIGNRDSRHKYKTVVRPSYLYYWNSYTGNITSLYWIRDPEFSSGTYICQSYNSLWVLRQ